MRLNEKAEQAMTTFIDRLHAQNASEHTIRAYERGVRFFLAWLTIDVVDVTPAIVIAWREELGRWNIASSTRVLRFAAVKTFFRLMHDVGVIDVDPAIDVELPKREHTYDDRPVLSEKEASHAIDRIDTSSPLALRDRAILEVLVATGIRNSELRSLSIDDVDLEDHTLLVRNGKGRKARILPLGRAAATLTRYIEHARTRLAGRVAIDALFVSREHRKLSRKALVRITRTRAGVAPHRLRHTCATNMLHSGAQREKVQALLGHASFQTTKIYVH